MFKPNIKPTSFLIVGFLLIAPLVVQAGCCQITIATGAGSGRPTTASYMAVSATDKVACDAAVAAQQQQHVMDDVSGQFYSDRLVSGTNCVAQTNSNSNNSWLPTVTNPFNNLEVKIPTLTGLSTPDCSSGTSCKIPWIAEYIRGLYKYGLSIGTMLAILSMMIGGVMWLISGGQQNLVKEAKAWIFAAISGSVLLFGSYLLLETLNPNLVNLNTVDVTNAEANPNFTSGGGELTGTFTGKPSFSQNKAAYDTILASAAQTYGLDCTLIKAHMMAESNGNPNAQSSAGAVGLMQLMPGTASGLGCGGNLTDPATSINCGAKFMAQLMTTACNGGATSNGTQCNVNNWDYRIAAYNAGARSNAYSTVCGTGATAWQCTTNVRYAETRNYVQKVEANYNYLKTNGWGC